MMFLLAFAPNIDDYSGSYQALVNMLINHIDTVRQTIKNERSTLKLKKA